MREHALAKTGIAAISAALVTVSGALAQDGLDGGDLGNGRRLALMICANCHIVARDQPYEPILHPPAASFEDIAQRESIDAASIEFFLATTHRTRDNPNKMPNPQLLDWQIKQVTAYLLSLRKVAK